MSTVAAIVKKAPKAAAMCEAPTTYGQVIAAARYYVTKEVDTDYKYLQKASYFFEKDGESRLASLLNEIGFKPTATHSQTHEETDADLRRRRGQKPYMPPANITRPPIHSQ